MDGGTVATPPSVAHAQWHHGTTASPLLLGLLVQLIVQYYESKLATWLLVGTYHTVLLELSG